jgi:hypothetical protein
MMCVNMWFLCKDILDSHKDTDFDVSFQNADSEYKYTETMEEQVWIIMKHSL